MTGIQGRLCETCAATRYRVLAQSYSDNICCHLNSALLILYRITPLNIPSILKGVQELFLGSGSDEICASLYA